MEYLYKINDYKKDEIERFVIKVNNLFPVSLSKKQDLKTYANKLMNNATIITATQQEEIIGMLAGYLNQEKAYISMLVVLPEHQGKNIGETLMRLFIQEAKKNKNTLLHLYAVETNIGAMKLYEKLGFEKYIIENEERPNDVHLCLKMED